MRGPWGPPALPLLLLLQSLLLQVQGFPAARRAVGVAAAAAAACPAHAERSRPHKRSCCTAAATAAAKADAGGAAAASTACAFQPVDGRCSNSSKSSTVSSSGIGSSSSNSSSSSSNSNMCSNKQDWALRKAKAFDTLLKPIEEAALTAAARSSSSSSNSSKGYRVSLQGVKHLKGCADPKGLQRFASELLECLGLKSHRLSVHVMGEREMQRLRDAYPSSSSSSSSSKSSDCSSSSSSKSSSSRRMAPDALSFAAVDPEQFAPWRALLVKAAAATAKPGTAATAAAAAAPLLEEGSKSSWRPPQQVFLGDIFLCPSVVYRQQQEDRMQAEMAARKDADGESLPDKGVLRRLVLSGLTEERLQLLLVHSVLHLLGFTHSTDGDAKDMREVEEFLCLLRPPQQHGLQVVGVGIDIVSSDRMQKTLTRLLAADAAAAAAVAPTAAAAADAAARNPTAMGTVPASGAAAPAVAEATTGGCRCSAMCRYTSRLLSPIEAADFRRRHESLFVLHWALKQQHGSSKTAAASAAVKQAAGFLSRRFATKEAAAKALGVGLRILSPGGVSLNEMEVRYAARGRPVLLLRGAAEALRVSRQLRGFLLSASDDGGFAIAQVMACS
ncbi:hypothetical protein Esti_000276 [Eimeria stiedai]